MTYRILVKDKDGTPIGEFEKFRNLQFGKKLNNYGECTFEIPIDYDKANTLYAPRRYEVEIYLCEEFTVMTKVWAGEQASRVASLTENGDDWLTITCYTFLEMLNHRFTVAERIFAIEDNMDSGDIAWTLIRESQSQLVVGGDTVTKSNGSLREVDDLAPWGYHVELGTNYMGLDFGTTDTESAFIFLENFGFSIPSDAVITGIEFTMNGFQDKGTYCKDAFVNLVKHDIPVGNNLGRNVDTFPNGIYENQSWGGAGNLWGLSLTPEDVNDPQFGVRFSFTGKTSILDINADSFTLKVYYAFPDPKTNFGITRGVSESTIIREVKYYNQNIMNALIDLSNMNYGFDFDIDDDKKFHVWATKGEDRSEDIQLTLGLNVKSATVIDDFSNPGNRALVLGQAYDNSGLLRTEVDDTDSQEVIKLREYVDSQSEITDDDALQALGEAVVRKYKQPVLSLDLSLVKNSGISPKDFSVGDTVRVIVKKGIFNYDTFMRIHQWDMTINDDGTEDLQLLVSML